MNGDRHRFGWRIVPAGGTSVRSRSRTGSGRTRAPPSSAVPAPGSQPERSAPTTTRVPSRSSRTRCRARRDRSRTVAAAGGRQQADDRAIGEAADSRQGAVRGRSSCRSWPRLGDLTQPAEVDLRVDRGGRQVAVAQHLADVHQRGAAREHLRRERVPEPGRPDMRNARLPTMALHDIANEIGAGSDGSAPAPSGTRFVNSWRPRRSDTRRAQRRRRPVSGNDARARLPRTITSPARQSRSSSSSRATYIDRNPSLAAAVQHPAIPGAVKGRSVAAGQQPLNVRLRHRRRDRRLPPPRDPGTDSTNDLGVNPRRCRNRQQRPELRDLPLREPEAHSPALAQQEPRHHRTIKVGNTQLVRHRHPRGQEPAGQRLIPGAPSSPPTHHRRSASPGHSPTSTSTATTWAVARRP